ncbi:hypothetical protein IWX46DRAFT_671185 [Phyllosticta citricarpa]|uniref:Uncharacterized protein n=1 Tax=Phyllosticta citricarpa TaxID=55181 RepID=A0ABR1MM92_9PEZI
MHLFLALCALSIFATNANGAAYPKVGQHGLQERQLIPGLPIFGPYIDPDDFLTDSIDSTSTDATGTTAPTDDLGSSSSSSTSSHSRRTYSYFIPSPSAFPIPVTLQHQVETTYIPRYTTCRAVPETTALPGPPYLNNTPTAASTTSSTCETFYDLLETTLCHTTLVGLATRVTITDCLQEITFSSDFGAALVTPSPTRVGSGSLLSTTTPSASTQLQTTYYISPWHAFVDDQGRIPEDVDVKVCHARSDNSTIDDCIREEESWAAVPVVATTHFTTSVDMLATLTDGPGTYYVGTVHGHFIGNRTTVSLSTTMVMNWVYEAETISRGPRVSATPAPGPLPTGSLSPATETDALIEPSATISSTSTRTNTLTRTVVDASTDAAPDATSLSLSPEEETQIFSILPYYPTGTEEPDVPEVTVTLSPEEETQIFSILPYYPTGTEEPDVPDVTVTLSPEEETQIFSILPYFPTGTDEPDVTATLSPEEETQIFSILPFFPPTTTDESVSPHPPTHRLSLASRITNQHPARTESTTTSTSSSTTTLYSGTTTLYSTGASGASSSASAIFIETMPTTPIVRPTFPVSASSLSFRWANSTT